MFSISMDNFMHWFWWLSPQPISSAKRCQWLSSCTSLNLKQCFCKCVSGIGEVWVYIAGWKSECSGDGGSHPTSNKRVDVLKKMVVRIFGDSVSDGSGCGISKVVLSLVTYDLGLVLLCVVWSFLSVWSNVDFVVLKGKKFLQTGFEKFCPNC